MTQDGEQNGGSLSKLGRDARDEMIELLLDYFTMNFNCKMGGGR